MATPALDMLDRTILLQASCIQGMTSDFMASAQSAPRHGGSTAHARLTVLAQTAATGTVEGVVVDTSAVCSRVAVLVRNQETMSSAKRRRMKAAFTGLPRFNRACTR